MQKHQSAATENITSMHLCSLQSQAKKRDPHKLSLATDNLEASGKKNYRQSLEQKGNILNNGHLDAS